MECVVLETTPVVGDVGVVVALLVDVKSL